MSGQIPSDDALGEALTILRDAVASYMSTTGDDPDKIAKSKDFVRHLFDRVYPPLQPAASPALDSVTESPAAATPVAASIHG